MKLSIISAVVAIAATGWLGAEGYYLHTGHCPLSGCCDEQGPEAAAPRHQVIITGDDAPCCRDKAAAAMPVAQHDSCCPVTGAHGQTTASASPATLMTTPISQGGTCPMTPDCKPGDPNCADEGGACPMAPACQPGDPSCPMCSAHAKTGLDTPASAKADVCDDCGDDACEAAERGEGAAAVGTQAPASPAAPVAPRN
jgi:hypothetical protein